MNRPSKITAASLTGLSPVPVSGISPQVVCNEAGARPTSDGWGSQPLCKVCSRGAITSCLCGPWPEDDDMMPAADVVRIMGDYFPDTGWARAEASACGMGAK